MLARDVRLLLRPEALRRLSMRSKALGVLSGALLAGLALPRGARAESPAAVAEAAPAADEASKPEPARPFELYWKEGETVFETDGFRIGLSNRIQFRFTDQYPDGKIQLPGTEHPGDAIGTFRIRRAKTQLAGYFWKPEIQFELQIGWAGSDATGGSSTFSGIEDALLNWDASKKGTFQVRVGQYKVPFGRQEFTSSERQQFVDRSILSGEFSHSRDVGVTLWGRLAGGKVEYWAGMFNGNGRQKVFNDNNKYQYDLRLMYQPWGDVKYSEGDFESKDRPLLAIAAGFEKNNLIGSSSAPPGSFLNNTDDNTLSGDVVFKYRGFSAYAEYFSRKREPQQGAGFHSDGWQVQGGYFLKREVFELAFRYAWWDPSDQKRGDDQTEIGGAANYYFLKHRFKLQADYRSLKDETRDETDKELRAQLQFVF
jgi:hypothetical protein